MGLKSWSLVKHWQKKGRNKKMLANYGYKDGSGDYYITIDTDKCDGCGECVTACPAKVLETRTDESDPFRDLPVAAVTEEHRKKIKYS